MISSFFPSIKSLSFPYKVRVARPNPNTHVHGAARRNNSSNTFCRRSTAKKNSAPKLASPNSGKPTSVEPAFNATMSLEVRPSDWNKEMLPPKTFAPLFVSTNIRKKRFKPNLKKVSWTTWLIEYPFHFQNIFNFRVDFSYIVLQKQKPTNFHK